MSSVPVSPSRLRVPIQGVSKATPARDNRGTMSYWLFQADTDYNLKREIPARLHKGDSFLASDYIHDIEVKQAMAQHASGNSHVIPIFVRDCSWTTAPFAKLQGVPKGKAVKLWPDRDTAWREVSDWIRKIVDERIKATP
jgi:hypothetical protein